MMACNLKLNKSFLPSWLWLVFYDCNIKHWNRTTLKYLPVHAETSWYTNHNSTPASCFFRLTIHVGPYYSLDKKTQGSPSFAHTKGLQSPFSSNSCPGLDLIQMSILIILVRLAAFESTGSGEHLASTLLITSGLVLGDRL